MRWLKALVETPDRRLGIALFLFLSALYIPFAGNYGLWDPWETHYSEVARQMLMRHDYVSLWWPGSPQDHDGFWSKPVLTFWLMALGMAAAGLERGSPAVGQMGAASIIVQLVLVVLAVFTVLMIAGREKGWRAALMSLGVVGLAVIGCWRVGLLLGAGGGGAGPVADHSFDGEMATAWTAEWAVRIPFILCGMVCVWAVWELVRRMAGRRAALWTAVVLATSSQFGYIARQAMTDMAFVAPMAVALSLGGLALMLPREESDGALPRRSFGAVSWPHTPSFYVLMALVVLTVLPQLVIISTQVHFGFALGKKQLRFSGVLAMLPYILVLAVWLWYALRLTSLRQIYFHVAFLMCGLATLAKGPAGVAMPVFVILVYVVATRDWKRLLPLDFDAQRAEWKTTPARVARMAWSFLARHPLEIGLGVLLFIAVTFPWYHAMLIRHGNGFWNEFIGDNYVKRAAGRHGDRGTFEYYLLQIGHGMFPWSAIVPVAALTALARLKGDSPRAKLRAFAVVWFLVMFAVVSLVNTKFHHYILPGLPALAILAGLYLDELFTEPRRGDALPLLIVGLPMLVMAGRDLAMFPARLTWLFDYDYVNAPNGGRPWPQDSHYDYTYRIAAFVAVAALANVVLAVVALWRAGRGERVEGDDDASPSASRLALLAIIPVLAVAWAAFRQPPFGDGTPHPLDSGWIIVARFTGLFLLVLMTDGLRKRATVAPTLALLFVGVFACAWSSWSLNRLLTDLSPHWSQKHVMAAYYKLRKDESEPMIAFQMYWRGETFYTKNAIYDHRAQQTDKTVFLAERYVEKLQAYMKSHSGRRMFFLVERSRFEQLRGLLPEAARTSLKAVDETNNKVFLAVGNIPVDNSPPAPVPAAAGPAKPAGPTAEAVPLPPLPAPAPAPAK